MSDCAHRGANLMHRTAVVCSDLPHSEGCANDDDDLADVEDSCCDSQHIEEKARNCLPRRSEDEDALKPSPYDKASRPCT